MKVNIKGLVFTGFAAAILSANAMAAGENVVTSKSYTDATYQVKSSQASIGSTNGSWVNLATTVDSNSTDATAPTAAAVHSAITSAITNANLSQYEEKSNKLEQGINTGVVIDSNSTDTQYPSARAVYEAIAAVDGGAANTYQEKSAADLQIGMDSGEWAAMSAGSHVNITTNQERDTITIDVKTTDSAAGIESATSTSVNVPTDYAVKEYVDAVDSAMDARVDALESTDAQANWTETNTAAVSFIKNKPTLGAAAPKDVDSSVSSSNSTSTNLPTTAAVYDYVQSVTGGTTIPARNASVCTDSTPCALVYEADGAHWRTMATATDTTGGACGDAAGTGCNTGA